MVNNIPALQKGITLIVALVMLLVMTTAGVTIMSGATLQERIAGNQRQRIVARLNADAALVAAETYLESLLVGIGSISPQATTDFASNNHLYTPISLGGGPIRTIDGLGGNSLDRLDDATWIDANSLLTANGTGRYIIEYMGSIDESGFEGPVNGDNTNFNIGQRKNDGGSGSLRKTFRITALGYADNPAIVSVLESYYFEVSQE